MKHRRTLSWLFALLWIGTLALAAPSALGEGHPIEMTVTLAPETRLEGAGVVPYMVFTLHNRSDAAYTLHDARLLGGYDGTERHLNGEITVQAGGTKEFRLENVPVAEAQLDQDVVYTLIWNEYGTMQPSDPSLDPIPVTEEKKATVTVRVNRFVLPKLTVSAATNVQMVNAGDTFVVTYRIANETRYDMTGVVLTDPEVFAGTIPLPGTDISAGVEITVPVEYTMADSDMNFRPVVRYVALQQQTETAADKTLTIESVVTGVRIEVEQYPSDQEGTTFAVTVINTGNRTLRSLQLYDEINTVIDKPFDLAAQQQKVLSFHVPSAYASGLIRRVRFHISGIDVFQNVFNYTDTNTYECVPYVASDSVRLSLLVTLTNAYYDEAGKLCGEIQFEIRNYSDVRIFDAVLSELTLFGTVNTYGELSRGETFYTTVYQLDNVANLSFRVNAVDSSQNAYSTETISLDLGQLPALAARTEEHTIIYNSNTYLKDLADRIYAGFRTTVGVVLILVLAGGILCLILWFLEYRLREQIRGQELLALEVPGGNAPGAGNRVLSGSPAEQLGYTAPAKMRYGAARRMGEGTETGTVETPYASFEQIKKRVDAQWANPAHPKATAVVSESIEPTHGATEYTPQSADGPLLGDTQAIVRPELQERDGIDPILRKPSVEEPIASTTGFDVREAVSCDADPAFETPIRAQAAPPAPAKDEPQPQKSVGTPAFDPETIVTAAAKASGEPADQSLPQTDAEYDKEPTTPRRTFATALESGGTEPESAPLLRVKERENTPARRPLRVHEIVRIGGDRS